MHIIRKRETTSEKRRKTGNVIQWKNRQNRELLRHRLSSGGKTKHNKQRKRAMDFTPNSQRKQDATNKKHETRILKGRVRARETQK